MTDCSILQFQMNVAHKAVDALEREGGESYEVGRPFELLCKYNRGRNIIHSKIYIFYALSKNH